MLNTNYREVTDLDEQILTNGARISTHVGDGHGGRGRTTPRLELWGGVECTVNRVGDEYFDQIERNGHAQRLTDLDVLAGLGIRTMRYPIVWERTAPNGVESADWSWADQRLARLRELGVRPIAGLVHHGSGPRDTSLIDPLFPEKLARYARAVAERFPWVDAYTPINEILTTARFSGLYGHWYPHGRDPQTFSRALISECRGTILAMRAIRDVNPRAQLVQTDDLGKTYSTPLLSYQAEFENERRWIGWDLLCGRLTRDDVMWKRLLLDGVSEAELEWFQENPCPPDILGVNHYPNSERMLDERLERYPEWSHGGNGRHAYADVEAVRLLAEGLAGPRVILREAWDRYHLPMAVTEVHHGCTRDEQMRWVLEVWQAGQALRRQGVDLRAITAWAMLGLYDWDQLCVRCSGHYEPGVFDVRSGAPRATALAGMLSEMAAGRTPEHPVLAVPGWWKRIERVHYPAIRATDGLDAVDAVPVRKPTSFGQGNGDGRGGQPLLISGAGGKLGRAFAHWCEIRGLPYRLLRRRDMDIAIPFEVEDALDEHQPWAVINAAGYARADDAEEDAERCFRENAEGAATLAVACARRGIPLVSFSSDLVFDGAKTDPYLETDAPAPLSVYGRSKAEAERRVLRAHPEALVIRAGAILNPWDDADAVAIALRELAAGRPYMADREGVFTPAYASDLVNVALDLLIDGERGVWHLANEGATTWVELIRRAAELAGVSTERLDGASTARIALPARRPGSRVLGSVHGAQLPTLESALERYVQERARAREKAAAGTRRADKPARTAQAPSGSEPALTG